MRQYRRAGTQSEFRAQFRADASAVRTGQRTFDARRSTSSSETGPSPCSLISHSLPRGRACQPCMLVSAIATTKQVGGDRDTLICDKGTKNKKENSDIARIRDRKEEGEERVDLVSNPDEQPQGDTAQAAQGQCVTVRRPRSSTVDGSMRRPLAGTRAHSLANQSPRGLQSREQTPRNSRHRASFLALGRSGPPQSARRCGRPASPPLPMACQACLTVWASLWPERARMPA